MLRIPLGHEVSFEVTAGDINGAPSSEPVQVTIGNLEVLTFKPGHGASGRLAARGIGRTRITAICAGLRLIRYVEVIA